MTCLLQRFLYILHYLVYHLWREKQVFYQDQIIPSMYYMWYSLFFQWYASLWKFWVNITLYWLGELNFVHGKWYVAIQNSSIAKTILTWKWKGKHINKGQYSIICLNVNHHFMLASTMYTNNLKINIDR